MSLALFSAACKKALIWDMCLTCKRKGDPCLPEWKATPWTGLNYSPSWKISPSMDGRPSIYLMDEVATKRERNFQLGALLFPISYWVVWVGELEPLGAARRLSSSPHSHKLFEELSCSHEPRSFFSRLQEGSDLRHVSHLQKKRRPLSPWVKSYPMDGIELFSFLKNLTFHGRKAFHIPHGRGCHQARKKLSARSASLPRFPTNKLRGWLAHLLINEKMSLHQSLWLQGHLQRREKGKTITDVNTGHFGKFPTPTKQSRLHALSRLKNMRSTSSPERVRSKTKRRKVKNLA